MKRLAFIDIGTNSVLLLIIDQNKNALADEANITRLGEGLATNKTFLPDAMDRTFAVLRKYQVLSEQHGVDRIIAVGTAAFRKAQNAATFVERVKKELGISIEIISGEREAELTWKAASTDFGEEITVIDIGGGSTEIVWYSSKKPKTISLPLGSVILTEQFCHSDPITNQEFNNLKNQIEKVLKNQSTSVPESQSTLVATAGTATTLAAIDLKLAEYHHAEVHGHKLSLQRLQEIIAELKSKTTAERKKILGLHPQRADVILAGAMILQIFAKQAKGKEILISDRGVRWGLAYEQLN